MSNSATTVLRQGTSIRLDLAGQVSYNACNKTRQGYARKRILKPAGYFFLGPEL